MHNTDMLPYKAFYIARSLLGFTQKYIADKLGVSQSCIARLEAGENSLSAKNLDTVGELLHISRDFLLMQKGPLFEKEQSLIIPNVTFWQKYIGDILEYCALKDIVVLSRSKIDPFRRMVALIAQDQNGTRFLFANKCNSLWLPSQLQYIAANLRTEVITNVLLVKLRASTITFSDLDSIFKVSPQNSVTTGTLPVNSIQRDKIFQTFTSLPDVKDMESTLLYSRGIGFVLGALYAFGLITEDEIDEAERKGLSLQLVQRGVASLNEMGNQSVSLQ